METSRSGCPAALWLGITILAIYTGGLYATDREVWIVFPGSSCRRSRLSGPSAPRSRSRWRERQQRHELGTCGPDVERIS
jgi:hypothetical protein